MITNVQQVRILFLVLFLLGLSGCSTMPGQSGANVPVVDGTGASEPARQEPVIEPQKPSGQASRPTYLPPPVESRPEQSLPANGPAVVELLNNAEKEQQAGRHDHAAATIERALGLEPQSALLWSRLAAIRLDQGNWQQADVLAGKSNSLARNNRNLQFQNWRIIERAKTGMGDAIGAAAARQMISRLAGGR